MSNSARFNWLRLPTRSESPTPFDESFGIAETSPFLRDSAHVRDMRVDITEDDVRFRIRAEIPGVEKDDIDVSVRGNQVVISTEVKHDRDHAQAKELIVERCWGKAYRAFILPSHVDGDVASTHYARGVLTLTLHKKAGENARLRAFG